MSGFPKHELGQTLMLALHDFQCRLDEDLALRGVRGIRARHRKVFMYLNHHGASRSVDLAQKVGVTPQSMMKTVHELEELCLISRSADPLDSRAKLVALTVKGQAFIDELTRSTLTVWDQYATVVGERDLQRTILLLKELSALNVEEQLA
ncbi:MAG: DNA-binding MarR family transcriptional regulator [Halioglobus sp.]|jgi:DNA-binding MarR family transcriptional regulator